MRLKRLIVLVDGAYASKLYAAKQMLHGCSVVVRAITDQGSFNSTLRSNMKGEMWLDGNKGFVMGIDPGKYRSNISAKNLNHKKVVSAYRNITKLVDEYLLNIEPVLEGELL